MKRLPNYRPRPYEAFSPSVVELEILRTLWILYSEHNYEPVGRREFDLLYGQRQLHKPLLDGSWQGYLAFTERTRNSFELLLCMNYIEQTKTFWGNPSGLFRLTDKGYNLVEAYDATL